MDTAARETAFRTVAPGGTPCVWTAAGVARCTPETLRVIVGLLLEPRDLRALAAPTGGAAPALRTSRALDLLVGRAAGDGALAARVAASCARRTAAVAHLLECSPYEALALWARHGDTLSRREVGALLARLACVGDGALEPLARRLCRDVQLAALRSLPADGVGESASAVASGS